jgi:hypothetical protein
LAAPGVPTPPDLECPAPTGALHPPEATAVRAAASGRRRSRRGVGPGSGQGTAATTSGRSGLAGGRCPAARSAVAALRPESDRCRSRPLRRWYADGRRARPRMRWDARGTPRRCRRILGGAVEGRRASGGQ